ncbi:MAG: S-adenosylmethionine:tRNA ribosyltransferase-isomerase, partial [Gammaproteobacteria bacterium]|nr:S-adenosylmethionine:tRNA ribosyltransferase-isomerase [Gammaproteobacteria bacterium]
MDISDFDYELPEELIAQHPLPDRDQSRLLWRNAGDGAFREGFFRDLVDRLHPGDLLVANDTRVVPARLEARKPSGGRVEVMLERILSSGRFLAQLQSNRPVAPGQELSVADRTLIVEGREGRFHVLRIGREVNADGLFRDHGAVPLPPYIRRKPVREDGPRYQTVYAAVPGAVAAPTAGLHFTPELLRELGERGIGWTTVTLHVGAGTFLPVQDDDLETHRMHAEWIDVSEETCERVRQAGKVGGRVVGGGPPPARGGDPAPPGGAPRPPPARNARRGRSGE